MKATAKLLATALAAAAILVITDVQAQSSGRHGSGASGGTHSHGGHRGGHHHGRHHWHGYSHFWGPTWGWHFGIPLFWGAAWGWPYYYDYYDFPRDRLVYREVERVPEAFPEGTMVPRGEGAPTRGPLYMNYCESAKAYFPKVTKCPEGWRLATPPS